MPSKVCTKCGIDKPLDDYGDDKRNKSGKQAACRECYRVRMNKKYQEDPAYRQRVIDVAAARRKGETLTPLPRPTCDERFEAFLMPEPNSGCLLFMGHIKPDGYGLFARNHGDQVHAHRHAWESVFGLIPAGHDAHHLCGVRSCCEITHLEIVEHKAHLAMHREARNA